MSTMDDDEGLQAARAFFAQLQNEPGNLTAVQSDLVRLAKDRGFECSIADLTQALQEIWDVSKSKIPYSEPPRF